MRIAVLGGGHGSFAAAADLSEQGHSVALWRRSAGQFGDLATDRRLTLLDHLGRREIAIDTVTGSLGEALRGAELVLLFSPAFSQADLAAAIAPHLSDGQVLFLAPGTLGSVAMARWVREAGCQAELSFAETGTLPYLARKRDATTIAITVRAKRLPTGVFPARRTDAAIACIAQAYPSVHPIEDALSGALMNAGPIIHPPLILMNAGPLEHFERWDIHNEGTQPAIRAVTDRLDEERIAVREALGNRPYHYPLRDHYQSDRWMYGDAHDRLVDSGDWREHIDLQHHRYMTEDVALGLSLLVSVAETAGVAVPIAAGLLAIGRAVSGGRFLYGERSLADCGLGGLDASARSAVLRDGWPS
ncbi:MAG: NAD/NADP octopine/nopaline dehydrogenase family protein [Burkholderiaceae bacterium]